MVRIKFDNLIRVPICVYTETSQLPNGPDIDLIFLDLKSVEPKKIRRRLLERKRTTSTGFIGSIFGELLHQS